MNSKLFQYTCKLTVISLFSLVVLYLSGYGSVVLAALRYNQSAALYLQGNWIDSKGLVSWESIVSSLTLITKKNPENIYARARLASILTTIGQHEEAKLQALNALTLAGHPNSCYLESHDFIRAITRPPNYLPDQILDFADPQSSWNFFGDNGFRGSLALTPLSASSPTCVAWLSVDFDQSPNRYAILVEDVQLTPNSTYQLSASTKAQGISSAWLGIHSQWPGVVIPNTPEWNTVVFKFKTGNAPKKETVHIVISEGHGILGVRDIELTRIKEIP